MEVEYRSIYWKVPHKDYLKIRNTTLIANFLLIVAIIPLILSYNLEVFTSGTSVILYGLFTVIAMCIKVYSQWFKKRIILRDYK